MAEDVFEIVGTVVGGAFNVEEVVAEGGFAVVYRAFHAAFHAPVALKCLKVPTVRRVDQREFLERFRAEGEVMFRLSQSIPAVVRPLHVDAFETAAGVFVPYMALEWLDGETLDVMIAKRYVKGMPPMSPKRVVGLLAPVARALQRAHRFPGENGPISIIHRDLKPDNIVVAEVNGEEVIKILDFGIAKVKSVAVQVAGRQSQEDPTAVPFTPAYAAPEQWFPKRYGQSGPWTDVWGLALCAVESMSGKPAIDGDHSAMMGTAVDEKRRPTPREEGATVSDKVEAVFKRALAVDPRDRFHDVGAFWDALETELGLTSSRALAGAINSMSKDTGGADSLPPPRSKRVDLDIEPIGTPTDADGGFTDPSSILGVLEPSAGGLSVLDLAVHPTDLRSGNSGKTVQISPEFEIDIGVAPNKQRPNADQSGRQAQQVLQCGQQFGPAQLPSTKMELEVDPKAVPRNMSSALNRNSVVARLPINDEEPQVESHMARRLGVPIALAVIGIAIALVCNILAGAGVELGRMGPISLNVVAGLITMSGIAWLCIRVFWPED